MLSYATLKTTIAYCKISRKSSSTSIFSWPFEFLLNADNPTKQSCHPWKFCFFVEHKIHFYLHPLSRSIIVFFFHASTTFRNFDFSVSLNSFSFMLPPHQQTSNFLSYQTLFLSRFHRLMQLHFSVFLLYKAVMRISL